ncbi:PucR family transcriptional regulator [Leucobacter edaphi]|uniref:PucR family transcriptional regulator n=1 Tax=Leucobacter edaphi TaxID=2796472 RepID=UPI0034E25E92
MDLSSTPLPAVSDVIAFPELIAAGPELVAGGSGMDRPVRWAHVVAGGDAIGLLDGGELVLTTGAGWPRDERSLGRLAEELAAKDPAAVVFEVGTHFDAAPAPLVAACEQGGIPLIALHREVRFVQLTQRLHQRVLASQHEALAARAEVHAMLTELGLNRSPVDYVIERLADTLDAPVVLADSAGNVVAWAGRGAEPEEILGAWQDPAAGGVGSATGSGSGNETVPVEAQGKRWGHLTALPGPQHAAGRRTVLELGAFALALGRLADADGEQWLRDSSKRMFDALLTGRFRRDAEIAAQLTATGLPVAGRVLAGATLSSVGAFGAHGGLERTLLETALRRAVAPEGRVLIAQDPRAGGGSSEVYPAGRRPGDDDDRAPDLLVLLSFPGGDPRLDPGRGAASGGADTAAPGGPGSDPAAAVPPLAARLARELDMLIPTTTPPEWRAHLGLGVPARSVRGLITSLEQVRAAGRLSPTAAVGRVTVQEAERQALAFLVRGLSASPEVNAFASETLGPLLAHDAGAGPGHSGDLVRVLQAYLRHPTNRSLAAQRARLSRSVFYQRLALIEEVLGVDLADGPTIATLTVALLAHEAGGPAPRPDQGLSRRS